MTQTEKMSGSSCTSCSSSTPKFKPLGYRVLLRRLEVKETSKGGIILPSSAEKQQEQAEVIAIGESKKDNQGNIIDIPVNVGDIVLVEKYAGQEVTIDDKPYIIAKADDLIAKISK